jgi:Protein of unknown function (DUF2842)
MDNAMNSNWKPTWRKPIGILGMIVYIALWTILVVSQWAVIGEAHILAQAIIYCVLGVIWIVPLKPLLLWMETGKWRE